MNLLNLHDFYQRHGGRSPDLDVLRGLAILLMLIFHCCFDLNHFGFIQIDIYNHHSVFWKYFRYIIVTLFLLCVGISLYLANAHGFHYQRIIKRGATLLVSAIAITGASVLFFPHSWIYFGVIHFIFIASLLGLLFVRIPHIAALVGIMLILLDANNILDRTWMFTPFSHLLPSRTEDLVPLTPWMAPVLLGIFVGHYRLYQLHIPHVALLRYLALLGRHSLLIYLTHQPLLFGGTLLAHHIFS